ncbi:hypothetical protein DV735_g3278, partial [Chaetothyriales sp. CBS 134920]
MLQAIGASQGAVKNILFTSTVPIVNGIALAKPDYYYGARPEQIHSGIRDDLSKCIIPSKHTHLPAVPNFFLEAKGPDRSGAEGLRQACHDGAIGARAIQSLRSYGQSNPVYDNNAYTISSTYHLGQLKMYSHTVSQPKGPGTRPEYYMHQLNAYSMTGNKDAFLQGATAFKNAMELTEEHRNTAILHANERAQTIDNEDGGEDRGEDEEVEDDQVYHTPPATTDIHESESSDENFSSGPESSPADPQANNDDTPDPKPFEFKSNHGNGIDSNKMDVDSAPAQPSGKRNSLFGMYGKFAPSPSASRKPFNDALEKRIHKRRRRAQDFSVSKEIVLYKLTKRSPSKTLRPKAKNQQQEQANEGLLTRIFTFLTTYPSAPAIIAKYLQILSNVFIFTCVFYLLFSAVATIRNDIDRLADETVSEILAEMSTCSRNYIENRCAADTRLPALETVCSNWEICMQRDPNAVKRARLSARTLADILNGFVEPISWKTMAVMFAGLVLVLLVTNGTFTLYRRQYEHNHPPPIYWPQSGPGQLHPTGISPDRTPVTRSNLGQEALEGSGNDGVWWEMQVCHMQLQWQNKRDGGVPRPAWSWAGQMEGQRPKQQLCSPRARHSALGGGLKPVAPLAGNILKAVATTR